MAHLRLHPETPPASPMLRPGSVPPALPRPRSLPMAPAPARRAAAERVQRVVGRPVGLLQMGLCWRNFPEMSGMNHDIMENSIGGLIFYPGGSPWRIIRAGNYHGNYHGK